jgi:hypothetical protein
MGDAGPSLGFASRKVPSVEVADDFGGDESARLFEAGVLMAEITVDVAAAAHEFKVVVHFSASLIQEMGRASLMDEMLTCLSPIRELARRRRRPLQAHGHER